MRIQEPVTPETGIAMFSKVTQNSPISSASQSINFQPNASLNKSHTGRTKNGILCILNGIASGPKRDSNKGDNSVYWNAFEKDCSDDILNVYYKVD